MFGRKTAPEPAGDTFDTGQFLTGVFDEKLRAAGLARSEIHPEEAKELFQALMNKWISSVSSLGRGTYPEDVIVAAIGMKKDDQIYRAHRREVETLRAAAHNFLKETVSFSAQPVSRGQPRPPATHTQQTRPAPQPATLPSNSVAAQRTFFHEYIDAFGEVINAKARSLQLAEQHRDALFNEKLPRFIDITEEIAAEKLSADDYQTFLGILSNKRPNAAFENKFRGFLIQLIRQSQGRFAEELQCVLPASLHEIDPA